MDEMLEMFREILSSAYDMGRGDGINDAQGKTPQFPSGDAYAQRVITDFQKKQGTLIEQLAKLI